MLAKSNRHGWRGEAFAIPALELHASALKRRRSERSTCQTSGLSFSALRAPNGRLFRASRSKAPEDPETAMNAQPTIGNDSTTAPPEVRP